MTQTTDSKNIPLTPTLSTKKRLGKKKAEDAAAPEAPATGLVESAACPETGATYSVGDWVAYNIKGAAMTGQILTLKIQAPPFQPVASVPNNKTGLAWTLELRELQPALAPEADNPFPVSEAEIDAAIIGTPAPVASLGDVDPNQIRPVPWNTIHNSPLNPRKSFEKDSLKELAISIYREGLQQNLVVRPHPALPSQFEIAAGERRWRAIGLLTTGFEVGEGEAREWLERPASTPVNVLVRELSDLELLQVATAENVQRRRMTPLEEADAFAGLIDLGSDVEDIASRFGYGRRTVIRRVQISRNLIASIREKYNAGELTLAQVEVLAVAGPETQEAAWSSIKGNARSYSVKELSAVLNRSTFLVKYRQFPPNWYKGAVVEDDLFGDVEPYLVDGKQAVELQLKHAHNLADKDVKAGATFAAVELDSQQWKWDRPGTGVVYSLNPRTGELVRWEGMGPKHSSYIGYGNQPSHVAGDMEAAREQRQASSTAPTQPAGPGYPSEYQVRNMGMVRFLEAAAERLNLAEAAYLLNVIVERYPFLNVPGLEAAQAAAVTAAGGSLVLEDGHLVLLTAENETMERVNRLAALHALRDLPDLFRRVLVCSCLLTDISANSDHDVEVLLADSCGPFILTEPYLNICNRAALLELWVDVGLSLEDGESQTDETLRAELLAGAADFQAEGFLPRPLREDGDE